MTSRTDRIEAAARALAFADGKNPNMDCRNMGAVFLSVNLPDDNRLWWHRYRRQAEQIIDAAFPELAGDSPTAWLAPMEPTEEMIEAGGAACFDAYWPNEAAQRADAKECFELMRQAYIKDT